MNTRRREHLTAWLTEAAAEFIARKVAMTGTIITVTRTDVRDNLESATVYISVWPETKAADALKAIRAVQRDFYAYADKKFTMGHRMPIEFQLDHGEEARRRFEELLRKQ